MTSNSGIGPVSGRTYYEIQLEQGLLDGSIQRRKPGSEVTILKPGEVPRTGSIWDNVDRGPPPPLEDEG